ncbi:MAG: OadG family protein [Anaerovoracaceae bacterium]
MQELGLMERFADPTLFESLTFGEKVAASLITTLMGMGTTFVILILLWGVIALTSGFFKRSEQKKSQPQPAASVSTIGEAPAVEKVAPQPVTVSTSSESGQELVAVIMAAIAASQGNEVISNLRIRKINRISGNRTPWNVAGSADCIESRKI